mmetsp:Transcript_9766/g.24330  ORF Transcript_9766/g.24330 Transcript_9766/m.24330 type:complete len:345 (-) Transcript_9766:521-1555(-)
MAMAPSDEAMVTALNTPSVSCSPELRFMPKMPLMVVTMAMAHVSAVRMRSVEMSWLRCWSSLMFTRSSVSLMYSLSVCSRLYVLSKCMKYASSNISTSATSFSTMDELVLTLDTMDLTLARPRCGVSGESPIISCMGWSRSISARSRSRSRLAVRLRSCMSSSSSRNFSTTSRTVSTRVVRRTSLFLMRRTRSRLGLVTLVASPSSAGYAVDSSSVVSTRYTDASSSRHASSARSSNGSCALSDTPAPAPPSPAAPAAAAAARDMGAAPPTDPAAAFCRSPMEANDLEAASPPGRVSRVLSSSMNFCVFWSSWFTTSTESTVMMALMCSRLTTMDWSRHRMADG